MKKIIYLLILTYLIAISALTGCSPQPMATTTSTTVPISKFTVTGTTITSSVNNPFYDNVSVLSFASPSTATFITLVKTAAPAGGLTFTESITTSNTPTYAAYQAMNNITGRNGVSGFAQAASAYSNPFAGEGMLRLSEAQLIQQKGSFTKQTSALAGPNALGNGTPDTVGTVNNFWVNRDLSGNLNMDISVTATCAYVGTNAYIYVDNSVYTNASTTTYSTANLTAISTAFDAIYTTDRATFGSEWKPGIDNDNHVTILISPAVNNSVPGGTPNGTLGYFWGKDEYLATTATNTYTDHSNQREMFYVIDTPSGVGAVPLWGDAAGAATNAKQGYAVLAHEFQHMINFNQKGRLNGVIEDTWINEGLSMYAMQACGYGLPQGDATTAQHVSAYLAIPDGYSLTNWTPANYGVSYLYMLYLVEHYGGAVGSPASQTMLSTMVASNKTGITEIESITGAGTFGTVFKNWAMANLLDGLTTNTLYNYNSINLNGGIYGGVMLTGIQAYSIPLNFLGNGTQLGWSAMYQRYTASTSASALNISITSGNAANNLEAVLVVK